MPVKIYVPFSKRNIARVKHVLITEQNDEFTIRAKTGWTRENNINTVWGDTKEEPSGKLPILKATKKVGAALEKFNECALYYKPGSLMPFDYSYERIIKK